MMTQCESQPQATKNHEIRWMIFIRHAIRVARVVTATGCTFHVRQSVAVELAAVCTHTGTATLYAEYLPTQDVSPYDLKKGQHNSSKHLHKHDR